MTFRNRFDFLALVLSFHNKTSGSHGRPSHSCDVGVSLIFGLVRGSGTFSVVFPTFVLVSRM